MTAGALGPQGTSWGKKISVRGEKISVRGEKISVRGEKSRFVGKKISVRGEKGSVRGKKKLKNIKKYKNCYRFGFGLPTETK